MPHLLQNQSLMPAPAYSSNGARLVSRTGEGLPLRSITISSEAAGGIARTTLRQHFLNEHAEPLELTYVAPLPADGAVAGFSVRAGSRTIQGSIAAREAARAQYESARVEGRTAALIEQERANLFTQQLGNIPPATDVVVELTIDHPLKWVHGGTWEWRFPTVVAPRYLGVPGTVADHEQVTVDVVDGATSPTASMSLSVADDLTSAPSSPTHAIVVAHNTVSLAGSAGLDRDIVVRWAAPRTAPGCSLRTKAVAPSGPDAHGRAYGLLTVVPPSMPQAHFARDLVLLLDVSGSMDGRPIEHLKDIVRAVVDSLDDGDRLEMIAFSSTPTRFRREPVFVSPAEKRSAIAWIQRLRADGGTELIPAIAEALRPLPPAPSAPGTVTSDSPRGQSLGTVTGDCPRSVSRQVLVVTDGLIGFEADAIRAIRDGLPPASRLHAVGVGAASNRAFLRPAARAGRGVEVLIDLDESAARAAEVIVAATREPVVVDVTVQGTALDEPAPRLTDLLAGSPVLAALRLRPSGGELVVRGTTPAGPWEERVTVNPILPGPGSDGVPALWARNTIEDLELDLACGGDRRAIDRRIEEIALGHSIASRLTSWVAVATEPSVDPRAPVRHERIPQALPYGMRPQGQFAPPGMLLGRLTGHMGSRMELGKMAPDDNQDDEALMALEAPVRAQPSSPAPGYARSDDMRRHLDQIRAMLSQSIERLHRGMARLRDILSGVEEASEMARQAHGANDAQRREIEAHRAELVARLEQLARESSVSKDDFERLRPLIEQLRQQIRADADAADWAAETLQGRILPLAGRHTSTVEFLAASRLDWQPRGPAWVGDRSITIVEGGTTRGGPVNAGSVVRLELEVAPAVIVNAGRLEIASGDRVLIVLLGTERI